MKFLLSITLKLAIVAQSMGGFSAPLACDRLPVDHLVLLNAMIPLPGETAGQWWDKVGTPTGGISNCRHDMARDLGIPDENEFIATYCRHAGRARIDQSVRPASQTAASALISAPGRMNRRGSTRSR